MKTFIVLSEGAGSVLVMYDGQGWTLRSEVNTCDYIGTWIRENVSEVFLQSLLFQNIMAVTEEGMGEV